MAAILRNGESMAASSCLMVKKVPQLHVEACVRPETTESLEWATLSDTIISSLYQNFLTLSIGEKLRDLSSLGLSEKIEFIQVADLTHEPITEGVVDLGNVHLIVNIFSFSDENTKGSTGKNSEDYDCPVEGAQTVVSHLPCRRLDGLWDSLVYEDQLQTKLFRFLCRMLALSLCYPHAQVISWNRVALLWGPPGTGKTSLCKALAQKIAIRMNAQFAKARLVEINAHSIFSKFFGESGRIVSNFFRGIEFQLEKEPDVLVFLLIDEIESLVSARERNFSGNEPRDTMRVVNSLLMALDRIRKYHNVLVFCTSNLMHAIDPAFLDRVDIKQHVPLPCTQARYNILRISYLELIEAKVLITAPTEELGDCSLDSADNYPGSTQDIPLESQSHGEELLPPYGLMRLYYWSDEQSVAKTLWNLAERCKGLSGRVLRRLPVVSLAMYVDECPGLIHDALNALSHSVEDELRTTSI